MGGLTGLTKTVAADYLANGIAATRSARGRSIRPAARATEELAEKLGDADRAYRFFIDRQPAGRFGTVDEIAGSACSWLRRWQLHHRPDREDGGITI